MPWYVKNCKNETICIIDTPPFPVKLLQLCLTVCIGKYNTAVVNVQSAVQTIRKIAAVADILHFNVQNLSPQL